MLTETGRRHKTGFYVPTLRTGTCGGLLVFEALGDIWVVLGETGIVARGNLRCHVANPSMVCLEIS